MKKQLSWHQNESGFYLPIVLVLTTLIFSFTTMFIYTYENQVSFTNSMLDQIELETLIQMTSEDFTRMVINENPPGIGTETFEYPNAEVTVSYEQEDEFKWIVECDFNLDDGRKQFKNIFPINIH